MIQGPEGTEVFVRSRMEYGTENACMKYLVRSCRRILAGNRWGKTFMEAMEDMRSWKLEAAGPCAQTKECDTFIGGKPKLPPEIDIPKCELCGKELTFLFQVAFPEGHAWAGKSMAVFYCVESWHDRYCIPELPQDMDNISEPFLRGYERNFRIIVFDTLRGQWNSTYQEKVAFQALRAVPEEETKQEWDLVIGGRPIWIMGVSEKPSTIAGLEDPVLLLQVREDFHFPILPAAPRQANPFAPGGVSLFPRYDLFAADRIYFWGVQSGGTEWIYTSVQRP